MNQYCLKSVVSYEFAPIFITGLTICRRKSFHICKNSSSLMEG
ncbi:MAG: hypothetical protein ACTSRI_21675 [Promethearchaeota archaeon]